MQLLLYLMIFRSIYGLLYKKEENRTISAESVIHVKDNVRTELTCVHVCMRFNADALYTKKKCHCVMRRINIITSDSPFIMGTYIKMTEKDKRMKDIGPIPIKVDQKIAIISKMLKTFHIQSSFKIDTSKLLLNKWHNLLHITIGKDEGRFGDRNPTVFVKKEHSNRFLLDIAWPDEGNSYKYDNFKIPKESSFFDSYFKVDYIQKETSNGYFISILINDDEVVKRVYSNPREIENLFVYAGDPWYYELENSTAIIRFLEGILLKWRSDE